MFEWASISSSLKRFCIYSCVCLFGQLTQDTVRDVQQVHQPLRVLRNLVLTADAEKLNSIGCELGLPRVLFELIKDAVESSDFIKVAAQD